MSFTKIKNFLFNQIEIGLNSAVPNNKHLIFSVFMTDLRSVGWEIIFLETFYKRGDLTFKQVVKPYVLDNCLFPGTACRPGMHHYQIND